MAPKSAQQIKASMAMFKKHSEDRIQDVKDFLQKYDKIESMTEKQQSMFESMVEKMIQQIDRYDNAWSESFEKISLWERGKRYVNS